MLDGYTYTQAHLYIHAGELNGITSGSSSGSTNKGKTSKTLSGASYASGGQDSSSMRG